MSNNNNKPTYTMSGSQSASVKYTMTSVANAIQNVATNIISPMSSSGYIYSPYVPLQTTMTIPFSPKVIPNIQLFSNKNKEIIYQFAIGKSYEFLFNYMKTIKPDDVNDLVNDIDIYSTDFSEEDYRCAIHRYVYEFKAYDKIFISEINEICNMFYYNKDCGKNNNDYSIAFVIGETQLQFNASELIDILDQGIIREIQ